MIISRDQGEVGSWAFIDQHHNVANIQRADWDRLLKMCHVVMDILYRSELLIPSNARLQFPYGGNIDAWEKINDISIPLYQHRHPRRVVSGQAYTMNYVVRTSPLSPLKHVERPSSDQSVIENAIVSCGQTLDKYERLQRERQQVVVYPVILDVLGTGNVLDARGHRQEEPNVIWLTGTVLTHPRITVQTQSDAWLPYTLLAEPQQGVYVRNAPRLEAVLHEIEQRLGIVPVSEWSSFSVPDGPYHLGNVMDNEGHVLPTLEREDAEKKLPWKVVEKIWDETKAAPSQVFVELTREFLRGAVHDNREDNEVRASLARWMVWQEPKVAEWLAGVEGLLADPPSDDLLVLIVELDGKRPLNPPKGEHAKNFLQRMAGVLHEVLGYA